MQNLRIFNLVVRIVTGWLQKVNGYAGDGFFPWR